MMAWVSIASRSVRRPLERRLPHRGVPLHHGGAPDVVDEDVEAALLVVDPGHQGLHLLGDQMVDPDGDAAPPAPSTRAAVSSIVSGVSPPAPRPPRSARSLDRAPAPPSCSACPPPPPPSPPPAPPPVLGPFPPLAPPPPPPPLSLAPGSPAHGPRRGDGGHLGAIGHAQLGHVGHDLGDGEPRRLERRHPATAGPVPSAAGGGRHLGALEPGRRQQAPQLAPHPHVASGTQRLADGMAPVDQRVAGWMSMPSQSASPTPMTAGPGHPPGLAEHRQRVRDVLEEGVGVQGVEGGVRERQRAGVGAGHRHTADRHGVPVDADRPGRPARR